MMPNGHDAEWKIQTEVTTKEIVFQITMRILQKSLSALTSSVHDRLWHLREMNSRHTVYCIHIHIADIHVSIQFICDLDGDYAL